MTGSQDSDLDDLFIAPRILEQRRTGIVHPLGRIGLDDIVMLAPMDLAVLGVEVTPQTIAEKVKAELERGIELRIYKWPGDEDFHAAMSEDSLEELCAKFEALYGNGADFRERMSQREMCELMRSYVTDMFGPMDDALPAAPARLFN